MKQEEEICCDDFQFNHLKKQQLQTQYFLLVEHTKSNSIL